MTRSTFIQLLDDPNTIGSTDIMDIQSIINQYPYFQSAQLLLTKAFHQTDNINFENSLKKTAAYTADRKQLHSLLFNIDSLDQPKLDQERIEGFNNESTLSSTSFDQSPESVSSSNETSPSIVPTNVNQEKKDEKETQAENIDLIEKQLLNSAISSSILLEVSNEIPSIDELQADTKETNIEINKVSSSIDEPEESFNDEETHSFSEWISFFNDNRVEIDQDSHPSDYFEDKEQTPINYSSNEIMVREDKAEFYSAAKMARLSVQEDDDLVTETLANIYADQGDYERAIKAYKKLQLKYPEKRVYFAGRIKEIQNQINS